MSLTVKITDSQYLCVSQWYIHLYVILRKAEHTICYMHSHLVNLLQEATKLKKNYQMKSCIFLNDVSSPKIFRPYTNADNVI
jgi:hypothetical protein